MFRRTLASLVHACAWTAALVSLATAGPLSLERAIQRALAAQPNLRAARLDARAASARVLDARRAPAPTISAELEDVGGRAGADGVQTTLRLERTWERGGDRAARTGSALAAATLAEADADVAAIEVAAEATHAFLAAWTARERLALARDALARAREAAAAAAERLRMGAAPASERARAEGFVVLRAIELPRAEAEYAAARRRLAGTWGADSIDADSLALSEPVSPIVPPAVDPADLGKHPAVRSAGAQAALGEWRVREARAARAGDLGLGAGVRRLPADGGTAVVIEASLPLPFARPGEGAVRAARAEHEAAVARAEAARRRLAHESRDALAALAAAEQAWALARGPLAEAADEALAAVTAAYRAGRVGYSEIAEGQRSRLEAAQVRIDALADLWQARMAVERLAGAPIAPKEEDR